MRILPAVLLLGACTTAPGPTTGGPVTLAHTFPSIDLAGGEERVDLCQSWTLGNDEPVNVNTVTLASGPGWHHSNWTFVPDDLYPGDDGVWPCADRNYDEASAGIAGGVLYAQSTQVTDESQRFPDGAAVVMPPHTKIVGETHALNASPSPMTTSITLTVDGLADDDVTVHLQPMALEYRALNIPAHATATFTSDCDIGAAYQQQEARAPDFSIYYALGHYHTLGVGAALTADGDPVFETGASIGHSLGRTIDPIYPMNGAGHLRFSCTFDNLDGDSAVGWGFGSQEMCVMLVFTDSPLTWAGTATSGNTVTGTDPDGTVENEAPCQLYGLAPRN